MRLIRPVITCFAEPESRNLNHLALILFFRAGGTRAAVSPKEAPETRGADRAAFPIPDGACLILRPGR
jgi:hypothetical protein